MKVVGTIKITKFPQKDRFISKIITFRNMSFLKLGHFQVKNYIIWVVILFGKQNSGFTK